MSEDNILTVVVTGDLKLQERFANMPQQLRVLMLSKMTELSIRLEAQVTEQKLSGQVLKIRTGNLKRSIFQTVTEDGEKFVGTVGSSGDVKYAAIHEFGGVIKHPGGTAYIVTKDGARFISNAAAAGNDYPRTKPHEIPMPMRSFLRSSLTDLKEQIVQELTETVIKVAKGET